MQAFHISTRILESITRTYPDHTHTHTHSPSPSYKTLFYYSICVILSLLFFVIIIIIISATQYSQFILKPPFSPPTPLNQNHPLTPTSEFNSLHPHTKTKTSVWVGKILWINYCLTFHFKSLILLIYCFCCCTLCVCVLYVLQLPR